MRILLLAFIFFISASAIRADYLETHRPANLRKTPSVNAPIVEHLKKGAILILLNDGKQTNGYYKVTSTSGSTGWIYRTLVRRFQGEPPITLAENLTPGANDVEVTVIDVGAGLSCLIQLPGNKYLIYDAGRSSAMAFLKQKLRPNATIEMMVLSHTDADHWGAAEQIIKNYKVKNVVRTDYRKNTTSSTYNDAVDAIKNATYVIQDYNLGDEGDIEPGHVFYNANGVTLTALCGFSTPPQEWGNLSDSKANNAVSIVMRLDYKGHSVLFTGDAVGRDDCQEESACMATEKFLVDHASALLDADVMIAPHHGADNASCELFIEKVSPEFVVFPAGHMFRHPRQVTAERYVAYGVDPEKIFRTDRGDLEESDGDACKSEWSYGELSGADKPGDDHVQIILPNAGNIQIDYLRPEGGPL